MGGEGIPTVGNSNTDSFIILRTVLNVINVFLSEFLSDRIPTKVLTVQKAV